MAKRRTRIAAKRADKRARKDRMREAGLTTGEKSKYARKVQRKRGRGAVDGRWVWWLERAATADASPLPGAA